MAWGPLPLFQFSANQQSGLGLVRYSVQSGPVSISVSGLVVVVVVVLVVVVVVVVILVVVVVIVVVVVVLVVPEN